MDLARVRRDLATAVKACGYTPYAFVPPSPELPAVIINAPTLTEYHQNLEGAARITIPISLLVSRADEQTADAMLTRAISTVGPGSFVNALEDADGCWHYLVVQSAERQYEIQLAEAKALGVQLNVQLLA